ncbi:MAG TPA: sigma 54-interacting transcriptional regulator [Polyangiaceae bacterium]
MSTSRDSDASTVANAPVARAYQVLSFGSEGHSVFQLPERGSIVVGRGREAHLRLESDSVSRAHAVLHLGPPLTIEDCGSANGTRVDGRPLGAGRPEPIVPGAIVEIGTVRLVVGRSLVGVSAAADPMERVRAIVERVARSDLSIIVGGETGVGKEVLVESIHRASERASGPLLRLNCAAFPENLLEAELFGYERGAFTGATEAKPGLLESARAGTILLDEVAELSLSTQAKFLGVLERREVTRLGALHPRPIDARFIAATHRDLDLLVVLGQFREDLHFRLNGITINVPPLRERLREVRGIAHDLLRNAATRGGKAMPKLTEDACLLLESYRWPGNVRELRQVLERAVLLSDGERIGVEHLVFGKTGAVPTQGAVDRGAPPETRSPAGSAGVEPEARRIANALERSGGNQKEAAKLLGISRRTLANRLDKLGLARPRKSAHDKGS